MSFSPGRSSSSSAPFHPSSSPSSSRRPSSSARSWSLSQSLLQNATASLESSSSAAARPTAAGATGSEQHSAKKSVVLVKLTDAAIRALEEYVKLANEAAVSNTEIPKPSIKFPTAVLGDALGGFSIPLAASAAAPGIDVPSARFSFSLSSTEDAAGPQGSFECLQADRPGSLQSVGPVQEKLQVQASDDSYTRFGQKMFEAKKESEKKSTQFLDRGPGSGSVSTVRLHHPPRPRSSSTPHMVNGQQKRNGTNGNNHSSSSSPSSGAINNHHHPGYLSGKHPMLDRKKNMNNYTKQHHHHPPAPTNSEVMKRPLKERIIHLLAVRPYKKPELITRIIRDGIREKDKKNITGYLKQVSFMKDNTYHLQRHMWNDVSEDWQFYSEQERQCMKRRKPQNLTPPCSDGSTSSSGHSPAQSSHHNMPSPPRHLVRDPCSLSGQADKRGLKRPRPLSGGGGFEQDKSKKQRVSNYVRPPDMQRYGNGYNSSSPRSPEPGHSPKTIADKSPGRPQGGGLLSTRSPRSGASPLFGHSPRGGPQQQQQHHSNTNGNAASSGTAAAAADRVRRPSAEAHVQLPDYELQFRTIENKEQRNYYKSVFTKERPRYLELYGAVNKVSQVFTDMESQMRQLPSGSTPWKRMKSKIMQEYTKRLQDQGFAEQKRELQYLHKKLAHIKGLVTKYDEMQIPRHIGGNGSLAVE